MQEHDERGHNPESPINPDFIAEGSRSRFNNAALIRILSGHRLRLIQLIVSSFAAAASEAALLVVVTGLAVNMISNNPTLGPYMGITLNITSAIWVGIVALLLRLLLSLSSIWISALLAADVTVGQRDRLAASFLHASWKVQSAEPPGRLQELLTSSVGRVTLTAQAFASALTSALSLIAFLVTSLALDVTRTIAATAVLFAIGVTLLPLRRLIRHLSAKWTQADVDFASTVSELGSLGLPMQTTGVRDKFIVEIQRRTRLATLTQRRAQTWNAFQSQFYLSLAYGAILFGVALATGNSIDSMATIGAVMLLMLRSLTYGQTLTSALATIAAYSPFVRQVQDANQMYLSHPAATGHGHPNRATPIIARDISFNYPNGRTALENISFTLEPNEIVGVIGPSGAGKSTIAQLLLGLREPTTGDIQVSGQDLSTIDRTWWAKNTSFVPQNPLLITGSVSENIEFFRDGIDATELRRVASAANLLAEIDALPEGFATHLGPRGSRLSGGQQQRLSIARALVGQPSLLVMDEPTSALDTDSENLVRESLERLRGQATILVIAHRMSTISVCDKVLVIENGKLTAQGNLTHLEKTSPFYQSAMGGSSEL